MIYVWVGSQGFTHVSTTKPNIDAGYWESHHLRTDVTVHVPRELEASWTVDWRLFPWSHLFVTSNMTPGMPALSGTGAPYS